MNLIFKKIFYFSTLDDKLDISHIFKKNVSNETISFVKNESIREAGYDDVRLKIFYYCDELSLYFNKKSPQNVISLVNSLTTSPLLFFLCIERPAKHNLVKMIYVTENYKDIDVQSYLISVLNQYFNEKIFPYSKASITLAYDKIPNNNEIFPEQENTVIVDYRENVLMLKSPNLLELSTYFSLKLAPNLPIKFIRDDKIIIENKLKQRCVWLDKPVYKKREKKI